MQETHQLLQPFSKDEEEFIEKIAAAKILLDFGPAAVLLKGGHLPGDSLQDLLVTPHDQIRFPKPSARRMPMFKKPSGPRQAMGKDKARSIMATPWAGSGGHRKPKDSPYYCPRCDKSLCCNNSVVIHCHSCKRLP